jgi:hypothetical protein
MAAGGVPERRFVRWALGTTPERAIREVTTPLNRRNEQPVLGCPPPGPDRAALRAAQDHALHFPGLGAPELVHHPVAVASVARRSVHLP